MASPRNTTVSPETREPKAIDRRIGRLVRARRLELGMSQEHLAASLGVTFQQVQKYEKGVNRIAASRLYDISRVLDLKVSELFRELESLTTPNVTKDSVRLMSLFESVENSAVRRQIIRLVESLVAEDKKD